MIKRLLTFFVMALWFTTQTAHAEIPKKPYYVGIQYGIASLYSGAKYHIAGNEETSTSDQNFHERLSKPSATVFSAGFHFTDNWAVETQYMISGLLNAPFFIGNEELFNFVELSGQSYGFYGVYQAGSKVFFKARLGIGQSFMGLSGKDVKANYSGFGLSYGFSVGHKLGKLGDFEISYIRYADATTNKSDACIVLEAGQNGSTNCSPGGADKYVKINEKMRLGAITVGYVFRF